MIRRERSAPTIIPLVSSEEAAHHRQAHKQCDIGTTKPPPPTTISIITTKPSLSSFGQARSSLLKPIVSRLPHLQRSLSSMPSLRRNLSILTQASTTGAEEVADTDWEGDTEEEDEDEEEGTNSRDPTNHGNTDDALAATAATATAVGGRSISSCLRYSTSNKSKTSNKVKFSLVPPSRKSSSIPGENGEASAESEEAAAQEGGQHQHVDGGSGPKSLSRLKKARRKRDLFIPSSIARPLRSPLSLTSPTTHTNQDHHHLISKSQPRPVRIFLDALPLPEKDPSVRASYPHHLLLDLNDLVNSSNITTTNNLLSPSTAATTAAPVEGPPPWASPTPPTALEALDLAARKTLFYADEVLYGPLKRNRYDYHNPHPHSNKKHGKSRTTTTTTMVPPPPPVPWNDARLRDLTRFWLRPEDGWAVVFRCEVAPWLGWFDPSGPNNKQIFDEWWDKSVECGAGAATNNNNNTTTTKAIKNNNKDRTTTKRGKERWAQNILEEDDDDDDDDDVNDEDWVCFTRKNGVLRIDLTAKFAYRPRSPPPPLSS